MRVLVTGAAGFIGYHVCRQLLHRGDEVFGVDCLNSYYDPRLKRDRLANLVNHTSFRFAQLDLTHDSATSTLQNAGPFDATIHLAAQAGVRYSQEAPRSYTASNIVGFINVLEACRGVQNHHLVFGSSSSVYGECRVIPVQETVDTTRPVSLYAATKMAGELMAYSYAAQYGLQVTALRFFTVYGPWGRPDMAIFKFTESILNNKPVELFAGGMLRRDFTFVDDTVQGILAAVDHLPIDRDDCYRVYNLGRGAPVTVNELLEQLERCLSRRAIRRVVPFQSGDVSVTYADIQAAQNEIGYQPSVSLADGLQRFVEWYQRYYVNSDLPLKHSA